MKVTLEVSNKPRGQVLHMLEKQVGVIFFYASHLFNTEEKISISAVDKTLDEVLERVFDGTGMVWSYDKDKIISVKPKKEAVIKESAGAVVDSNITSMTVTGKVISADGTPIPGATIIVKNSNVGDVSDANGNFSITASKKNTLIISSIGYETREISVLGKSILAELNLAMSKLDETVIVAYGTTTQRLNTGDVATVKGIDISKQPVSNPLQALQGRVSGLLITQNSGVSGGGYTVQIRGRNSIENGNNPLYIVDGMPYESTLVGTSAFAIIGNGSPLNYIDPMSIESIDVLKDADATSIYGSRGANGVILITTKKGRAGKLSLDFNVRMGFGKATRFMDLLSGQQYLSMRNEALRNDGIPPSRLDYDINGTWDTTKYTNWQKVLIGGRAKYNDYQMSLTSGTDELNFSLGMGYHNEGTVLPGNFGNSKYSMRFSLNSSSKNKKLKVGLSGTYLLDNNEQPTADITNFILTPPIGFKIRNDDGTLNWENSKWTNPFGSLERKYNVKTGNIILNSYFSYRIIDELLIKCTFGYTSQKSDEKLTTPLSSYRPSYIASGLQSSSTFNNTEGATYNIEPQLEYKYSYNRNKITFLVGTTILNRKENQMSVQGSGFISDDLLSDLSAASVVTAGYSRSSEYKYNALFGRINYDFANTYILQLTGRRDGSSRFGPGKQFANFGAIGVAWIFSNLAILKNNPILSFGKVRASYGTTGNDQIGEYRYLDLYSSSYSYQSNSTLFPVSLYNTNFAWERNDKLEFGVDMGILNDKIIFSSSYFRNRSGNQLVGYTLPLITGFSSVVANLPAIVQNTGLEFSLNGNILKTKSFSWQTSFNISILKNKLSSFPGLKESGYQFVVGQPLSVSKMFKYDKVDPESGIYQFIDSSGKSTFNPDFNSDRYVLKNTDPVYYGGLENSFKIKNFELSFLFQFVKKLSYDYVFSDFNFPGQGTSYNNQSIEVLDRWQKVGDNAKFQKFSKSDPNVANGFTYVKSSDRVLKDGSFVRLKNVQLSYAIPVNLLNRIHVGSVMIFLQGQNILTFTNYKGIDPENTSLGAMPPLRTYCFGVNVKM